MNGKLISLIQKFRYIYSDRILLLLMFSCSLPIKQPHRRCSLTKSVDTSTDMVSQFHGFSELQKKIETKQSFVSEKIKSSIISDTGYTSSIYQWRKVETAPIVKVIELAKRSEIDSFTGLPCTHNTIKPEGIYCRLSNFQQFSKDQMLYILKNMLEGHQAIFKKMRATSVSLEKCVVTPEGEIKVWVNQHLERNDISGEILSRQDQITKRIFQTVSFLASQNSQYKLHDFIQYVGASMKKSTKWTFMSLRGMLKSYIDCLRIKIPKNIVLKKVINSKRPVLSSMVENKNYQLPARPRQNSFQFCQRNIQSSLNCSRNSEADSNNMLFGNMLQSQIKNQTSKAISQKNSALRALVRYSKHTNSISLFKTQEDNILQKSQNQDDSSEGNPQNKKLPSINDILVTKIGICSLPQVHCEDEYSNSPSARKQITDRDPAKFVIASQFSLKIVQNLEQSAKPDKLSSISTTNQTSVSGNQFCFSKKTKESHMTINMDDKQNTNKNQQVRTASRDRFKDCKIGTMTQQTKKIIGSCTNWDNQPTPFNLSNIIKEVRTSRVEDTPQLSSEKEKIQLSDISSKMDIERQVVSFKNITESKNKPTTPVKSTKQILKHYLSNPLSLLNELRSEQQLESYETTQKNSSSCGESPQSPHSSVRKVPIQEKILELLQRNRNLVVSTYMQTNSQKKINERVEETPEKQRERRLKNIEETLSELVRANLKQEEILEGNSWTKKLENLLGMEDELKQSISFGVEEANALLRELKLSKLDKCGRHIGTSQFPESVSH